MPTAMYTRSGFTGSAAMLSIPKKFPRRSGTLEFGRHMRGFNASGCQDTFHGVVAASWSDAGKGETRLRGTFHSRTF
jgi:hypothetical protein